MFMILIYVLHASPNKQETLNILIKSELEMMNK